MPWEDFVTRIEGIRAQIASARQHSYNVKNKDAENAFDRLADSVEALTTEFELFRTDYIKFKHDMLESDSHG